MSGGSAEVHIPNEDKLYYHVPKSQCEGEDYKIISLHVFKPQGNSISTNWAAHCTPEECLQLPTGKFPNGRSSETHGVGHFIAGEIRKIELLDDKLTVKYIGTKANPSHAGIFGVPPSKPKEPFNEIKLKLQRAFKCWDIQPTDAV